MSTIKKELNVYNTVQVKIMPMVLKGGGLRGRGPSEAVSGMKEVNEFAGHSKVVEVFKNFNAYFAN